jgi:hypothetical protein
LSRNGEPLRKIGLRPVALGAQHLQSVLHWYRRFARQRPM